MKTCSVCKRPQPLAGFFRSKNYADGHRSQCKACCAKWRSSDVVANRINEKRRTPEAKSKRAEYVQRPAVVIKRMLYAAKHRAAERGIPFALVPSDIVIPDRCPVLDIPMDRNIGRKGGGYNSPSLDRVIPSLGYVPGNVRVISHRANSLKNDASIHELERVLAYMRETQE